MDFNPLKPFPSMVLAWIHFLGLSGFLYKWRNGSFVDLKKPLTSQILVNRKVPKVEFEALPAVSFTYGRYGHLKGLCLSTLIDENIDVDKGRVSDSLAKEFNSTAMGDSFGPWVIVERKYRGYQVGIQSHKAKIMATRLEGSRFEALNSLDKDGLGTGNVGEGLDKSVGHAGVVSGEPACINILKNASPTILFDNSSMHINLTFESPIKTVVDLNAEFLDPNRHSVVTFKENFDLNSSTNKVKDRALSCENPIDNAKKVVSGGKRAKCRLGNIINISIKSRGGHFKIAGSSRFPLLKAMNSMAKILNTQMELVKENTNVLNVSADSPNAS
ncbi:hypothetical protein Gotri_028230 [Gossypium trilobum]|uniref:DUF4283 domain-containing protein n=1 Tax=Gossypium trilobum TaxID=34281 RepID=A0A7J9FNA7_9ROSI|nr:hypothetical protein [Gossypium trilobum]